MSKDNIVKTGGPLSQHLADSGTGDPMPATLAGLPVDADALPVREAIRSTILFTLPLDQGRNVRIRIKFHTRHHATSHPHNEMASNKIDMHWLVRLYPDGRPLCIITQNDAQYFESQMFLSSRDIGGANAVQLLFCPCSPYIVDQLPAIVLSTEADSVEEPLDYAYEVVLGTPDDFWFAEANLSYREGEIPYGNWFHNKSFRWALAGARIRLPAPRGSTLRVALRPYSSTSFKVLIDDHVLAEFHGPLSPARWQSAVCEFLIPAAFTTDGEHVTIRIEPSNQKLYSDTNLRQSLLAVNDLHVWVYGAADTVGVTGRLLLGHQYPDRGAVDPALLADALQRFYLSRTDKWRVREGDLPPSAIAALQGPATVDAAVLIAADEERLLGQYFAPHSRRWQSIAGAVRLLESIGLSCAIVTVEDFLRDSGRFAVALVPDTGLFRVAELRAVLNAQGCSTKLVELGTTIAVHELSDQGMIKGARVEYTQTVDHDVLVDDQGNELGYVNQDIVQTFLLDSRNAVPFRLARRNLPYVFLQVDDAGTAAFFAARTFLEWHTYGETVLLMLMRRLVERLGVHPRVGTVCEGLASTVSFRDGERRHVLLVNRNQGVVCFGGGIARGFGVDRRYLDVPPTGPVRVSGAVAPPVHGAVSLLHGALPVERQDGFVSIKHPGVSHWDVITID